jgi:hypothetical protein
LAVQVIRFPVGAAWDPMLHRIPPLLTLIVSPGRASKKCPAVNAPAAAAAASAAKAMVVMMSNFTP